MDVKDTRRPEIKGLFVYTNIDDNFDKIIPKKLKLKRINDSVFRTNDNKYKRKDRLWNKCN